MNIVTFSVYRKDGSLVPTLVTQPFLQRLVFSPENLSSTRILHNNGKTYTKVFEPEVIEALKTGEFVSCIVSFQEHKHGNYAVVKKVSEYKIPRSIKNAFHTIRHH